MLPSANRLRRKSDFGRVYAKGRSCATDLIVMYVLRQGEPCESRIGFSVSRKLGKSVERNRVRRRLREAVRSRLPFMAPGYDVVVRARAGAGCAEFERLVDSVDRLGAKLGIISVPGTAA